MDNKKCHTAMVAWSQEINPASDIFYFSLRSGSIKKEDVGPGQFFSFQSLSDKPWRRPFSVAWLEESESQSILSFFIKKAGDNTWAYSNLDRDKDMIEIFGPLGKKFELLPGKKKYIFVGGGTGGAGLFTILKAVLEDGNEADFILGVKNECDIFGWEIFDQLKIVPKIVVENPVPNYEKGYPTDWLKIVLDAKESNTAVIACGPRLMLKKVFDLCQKYGVPCFVSVEELMACGTGSCGGCAIEMIDGTFKQVCKDGPIFDASLIKWENFLPPPAVVIKASGRFGKNPLEVTLGKKEQRKLEIKYPWGIAPGCVSLEEARRLFDSGIKVGFWRPKGVMLQPRLGNRSPRICEAGPGMMLNAIGLSGIGVDRFIDEEFFEWCKLGPVIVQIAGTTPDEFAKVAEKFVNVPVLAVDLNISCPNLKGVSFGTDVEAVQYIVGVVRDILPHVYLMVKLTPNVSDIVSIGKVAVLNGADCLTAINTLKGMLINTKTRRPMLGNNRGGLSGKALLPVGIGMVSQLFQANLGADINGVGGISCGDDGLQYLLAGANVFEVGTAGFPNKNIFNEITDTVSTHLLENGNLHCQDLVGAAELF
jgi:dihydroorotate dehydrogenase (NAD+) catalytic subunit